tara:strand:+ start:21350 stop:22276 length:927 start_codon:yes stop_codon:yes gene_type:complete
MAYLTGVSPALRELVTPTVDVFADGVGFNDGSSTYIDLSADPGNENNVHITFDGVTQHHDTYSVSGVRVTFDAAIPTGTAKIEARYAQENRNYTTIADNAVTNAKMADDAIGVAELSASGTASSSTFLRGDNAWASAGSNIKEMLAMVCDGSTSVVSSGSYTSVNVTSTYTSTTSYADITGSNITYTPPSGTTTVIYEFSFGYGYVDATAHFHMKFFVDGAEVVHGRRLSTGYSHTGQGIHYRWVIKIGDGAVANTGKLSSWTSGKELKMQFRGYSATAEVKMHGTTYWDGTSGNQLMVPTLTITALG